MTSSTESTAVPKALQRVYGMSFGRIYPLHLAKAEKKGRTKREVDKIMRWLTGYTQRELTATTKNGTDFETFFKKAPKLNPKRKKIAGRVLRATHPSSFSGNWMR